MKEVSIEDDMEDDFDDLLDRFQPSTEPKVEESKPTKASNPKTESPGATDERTDDSRTGDLSDEFARDLAEGMEALLAGMKREDGGEFKKHLEDLVSGEGNLMGASDLLEALGQTESSWNRSDSIQDPAHRSTGSNQDRSETEPKDFQEAIRETMEKLKRSDDSAKAKSGPSGPGDEDAQLSALFEKMMMGENGLPDENQLQTILQSFMEELMSKEIMYEPLKDMNRLFPGWIDKHRTSLASEDLRRYETQSKIIQEVIEKFEDPNWDSDERDGGEKFVSRQKEVIDLLTKMQDCGPPPKEILGDMPPGILGEDGLPNPEQCSIS